MSTSNFILMIWLIPCLLLILFWVVVNLYGITIGPKKSLSKKEKAKWLMPTPWCIIFALAPAVNFLVFIICCVMICFEENRKILFGEGD